MRKLMFVMLSVALLVCVCGTFAVSADSEPAVIAETEIGPTSPPASASASMPDAESGTSSRSLWLIGIASLFLLGMAKGDLIQDGEVLDYTNSTSSTISAGQMVVIGDSVGIVINADIAAGDTGALAVSGVYDYTAESGVAWDQGDQLYYSAGSDLLTKTAGANNKAGIAAAAKASLTALGKVKLNVNAL